MNGTPDGVSHHLPGAPGAAAGVAAAPGGGGGSGGVPAEVLERWAEAYGQLVENAAELGVPRRCVDFLSVQAGRRAIHALA